MKRGDKIGRFQILGKLGAGAHSSVLQVRRQADGRQYALKVVPVGGADEAKYLDQARHEYRVGGMLDHPNIVKLYALETQSDWLFRVRKANLLVEYVNGKPLDEAPVLPLPRLVQVFCRVASALVHMHRRNVWHADMKPGNLMLSRTGEVKVIDLGLAWVKGESKDRVQGTIEYMAPETAKHKTVNERSDIYNFGATMYRLLTFRTAPPVVLNGSPVGGKAHADLLKPVRESNPHCPEVLAELVRKCLAWKPIDRPERMGEVQTVLDGLAEQLVTSSSDKLERLEW